MRHSVLVLTGALVCGAALAAQQPPQPPPQPAPQPAPSPLDQVLANWERAMSGMNSFVVQCTLTTLDKTFQSNDVYEGSAKYLKPDRASLELRHKIKADRWKRWICSGTDFFDFVPGEKIVRQHKLQARAGQGLDGNFLSFVLGMKADEAKKRYQLTLAPPPKGDTWYHYIDVLPRDPRDKADFARARLVLLAKTYLPRQLWFEEPNGNEQTWDFPQVHPNVALRPEEFAAPALPADWRIVPVTVDTAPPRVIRQQQ